MIPAAQSASMFICFCLLGDFFPPTSTTLVLAHGCRVVRKHEGAGIGADSGPSARQEHLVAARLRRLARRCCSAADVRCWDTICLGFDVHGALGCRGPGVAAAAAERSAVGPAVGPAAWLAAAPSLRCPSPCPHPIQPRLLEQRSRPTPIHSRPAFCLLKGAP